MSSMMSGGSGVTSTSSSTRIVNGRVEKVVKTVKNGVETVVIERGQQGGRMERETFVNGIQQGDTKLIS